MTICPWNSTFFFSRKPFFCPEPFFSLLEHSPAALLVGWEFSRTSLKFQSRSCLGLFGLFICLLLRQPSKTTAGKNFSTWFIPIKFSAKWESTCFLKLNFLCYSKQELIKDLEVSVSFWVPDQFSICFRWAMLNLSHDPIITICLSIP